MFFHVTVPLYNDPNVLCCCRKKLATSEASIPRTAYIRTSLDVIQRSNFADVLTNKVFRRYPVAATKCPKVILLRSSLAICVLAMYSSKYYIINLTQNHYYNTTQVKSILHSQEYDHTKGYGTEVFAVGICE